MFSSSFLGGWVSTAGTIKPNLKNMIFNKMALELNPSILKNPDQVRRELKENEPCLGPEELEIYYNFGVKGVEKMSKEQKLLYWKKFLALPYKFTEILVGNYTSAKANTEPSSEMSYPSPPYEPYPGNNGGPAARPPPYPGNNGGPAARPPPYPGSNSGPLLSEFDPDAPFDPYPGNTGGPAPRPPPYPGSNSGPLLSEFDPDVPFDPYPGNNGGPAPRLHPRPNINIIGIPGYNPPPPPDRKSVV